jgi:penicillin-binding protein 2A
MQLAVLAAEDHRYYEHHGIDSLGILRATIDNIRAGKMIEGASTITQQLAKITFLNQDEKTAKRKLRQMVLAWELEEDYSKERILEAYLNTVYFGRGAYGIENAAQEYFGVHASQLSIAQSAFLAGLIKAPSFLGNKAHLKDAISRQRQVIENMEECNFISNLQSKYAIRQPLAFRAQSVFVR